NDLALIHHRNPGREIAHDRHGVRDKQISEPEIALQLLQQIHDLRADADVESGNRFVGDDELRTQRKCAGYANALTLASGKFVRITGHGGFIHAHGTQKFAHALAAGIAAEAFVHDLSVENQGLGDHVLHAVARVERAERVLEDDLQVAAKTAQFGAVRLQQIDAIENDGARSGLDEAEDEPSKRALAGAGFTNQAKSFAFLDVEGHIIHSTNFAGAAAAERRFGKIENPGQVADFKQRHGVRVAVDGGRWIVVSKTPVANNYLLSTSFNPQSSARPPRRRPCRGYGRG